MRHLCSHADAFTQRGVWVNGFANVHCVSAHLNGQCDFANHVARMGANDAAAQDLAVTVRFGRIVEQQFGETFVASVGNGAA